MIKAGSLDRRITVERATMSSDGLGGKTPTWAPLATVWGSKKDVSDSERVRALEVEAAVETRFVIRWGLGVTTRDRVICEGRTYDLTAVKEIGRHEGQELSGVARAD